MFGNDSSILNLAKTKTNGLESARGKCVFCRLDWREQIGIVGYRKTKKKYIKMCFFHPPSTVIPGSS